MSRPAVLVEVVDVVCCAIGVELSGIFAGAGVLAKVGSVSPLSASVSAVGWLSFKSGLWRMISLIVV